MNVCMAYSNQINIFFCYRAEFQSEKSFSNVPVSTSNSRSYSYSSSHEGAGPSGMVWGPPATSEGGMEDIEMKPYVRKRKRRSE